VFSKLKRTEWLSGEAAGNLIGNASDSLMFLFDVDTLFSLRFRRRVASSPPAPEYN
jgi:hypothetical protein